MFCQDWQPSKLYDTFGLSLDVQQEMARERNLTIDHAGFEKEMGAQRARARASWKGGDQATVAPIYKELREKHPTRFEGYGNLETTKSTIVSLLVDQQPVDQVAADTPAELVLDRTLFYGRGRRTGR